MKDFLILQKKTRRCYDRGQTLPSPGKNIQKLKPIASIPRHLVPFQCTPACRRTSERTYHSPQAALVRLGSLLPLPSCGTHYPATSAPSPNAVCSRCQSSHIRSLHETYHQEYIKFMYSWYHPLFQSLLLSHPLVVHVH